MFFLYKAKNKNEIKNKISETINLWTKKLDFELSNW
jgi:predicted transcriptional regulator